MKYKRWYDELMNTRSNRVVNDGYYEKHHIVPSACGGSNDNNNIVYLTAKEHFIAHWLLTKFTTGNEQYKMRKALHRMTHVGKTQRNVAAWQYELARIENAKAMIGNTYGRANKGRKRVLTDEWKHKIALANKGKKKHGKRKDQTGNKNHMYGKTNELHHNYGKTWSISDTKNYSSAGKKRWSNPEYRERMLEARRLKRMKKKENEYGTLA